MILKIFLKELKDTLRDKRTLIMMVVIPVLVFPVILNLFVSISASFEKDAAEKIIKIGFVGDAESPVIAELIASPKALGKMDLKPYANQKELLKDVKSDSLQMGIVVPDGYAINEQEMKPVKCEVYYDATDIGIKDRAKAYMEYVEKAAATKRYKAMELDESKFIAIETNYNNTASKKEMIGKLAGGILPYIFIAFGFIGCMYPAIDLFTGEKERGTIETLLTTPVSRLQILIGKMCVVVLSGLLAATCALVGLYFSIEVLNLVENEEILAIVRGILTPGFILMLFLLLFPLTVFFAGVMIPIAVYAKSFKEAQSIITPLNIVMVLPAMIGLLPGIELNIVTACIPVINVVLATKELIAGTLEPGLLILSFGIMVALAMIAVFVSYRQFEKETNIVM
jgi:sodium transport system permease protein|tara:strand:+ start:48574 stop:49764 length:1191 start_codon:yes stop_codon:yes gene_type:complete